MPLEIRAAQDSEFPQVVTNFRQMWLDLGTEPDAIAPDWREQTARFLEAAIRDREGRAFVAILDGQLRGSAVCQLFEGLYPAIVRRELRRYGYVWGVFVDREARRRGIASALTQAAVEYLREIACTRVILHASSDGRPVYVGLGFVGTNELALELRSGVDTGPAGS